MEFKSINQLKSLLDENKISVKEERLFKKNLRSFTEGFNDSQYQRGY